MRTAPAIVALVVGAAVCGGALEFLVPDGNRQTMGFDQFLATAGAWLSNAFMAVVRAMKER